VVGVGSTYMHYSESGHYSTTPVLYLYYWAFTFGMIVRGAVAILFTFDVSDSNDIENVSGQYLISDGESGHNYTCTNGERDPTLLV
jgi:hypothetical protein